MFSCRAALAASSHRLLARRSFATTQTGTMKFYRRDKGYGFVQPDDHPDTDIFVHRSDIVCTIPDMPREVAEPRFPYLREGERVRFEMHPEGDKPHATNVTWVDGTKIPAERRMYMAGVHERTKLSLGTFVYDTLLDHLVNKTGVKTDDEIVAAIGAQFQLVHNEIDNAERVLRVLGMDPADFPTKRDEKAGRHRRNWKQQNQKLFPHLREGGSSSSNDDKGEMEAANEETPSSTPTENPFEKTIN